MVVLGGVDGGAGRAAAVAAVRQQGLMVGVDLAPPDDGLRWGRRVCASMYTSRQSTPSCADSHADAASAARWPAT